MESKSVRSANSPPGAEGIRTAMARVQALRTAERADPALGDHVSRIKRFQAARFARTYADLMGHPTHGPAARFFLTELYGEGDYTERDAQFVRIAGTMEKLFPPPVIDLAIALANLHARTESLDHSLGLGWGRMAATMLDWTDLDEAQRYVAAWRADDHRSSREKQLTSVLDIGNRLTRLVRLPGLRNMLRMMRLPAKAAGLGALQRFLEAGFDTFGAMARRPGEAEAFLATIRSRESTMVNTLFDTPPDVAAAGLRPDAANASGQAP